MFLINGTFDISTFTKSLPLSVFYSALSRPSSAKKFLLVYCIVTPFIYLEVEIRAGHKP